jgi:hypothetical protein
VVVGPGVVVIGELGGGREVPVSEFVVGTEGLEGWLGVRVGDGEVEILVDAASSRAGVDVLDVVLLVSSSSVWSTTLLVVVAVELDACEDGRTDAVGDDVRGGVSVGGAGSCRRVVDAPVLLSLGQYSADS